MPSGRSGGSLKFGVPLKNGFQCCWQILDQIGYDLFLGPVTLNESSLGGGLLWTRYREFGSSDVLRGKGFCLACMPALYVLMV